MSRQHASAMAIPAVGPRARMRAFFGTSAARVATAALLILVAGAVLAPWIAPQNPFDLAQLDILASRLPPLSRGASGALYLLGTDDQGRDILSAILYGLRISLVVATVSVSFAFVLGTAFGMIAGTAGGRIDALMMRIVDIQLSVPAILVALVLLALLGRGVDKIIVALVSVQWVYFARTARAVALVEKRREYIDAARNLGFSQARILVGHLLPNALAPLIVVATVEVAHAIALEATLSFLGVGLPVTRPSLGLLIANGFAFMLNGEYWISVFPGVALVLVVFAINLAADRMRDVLDPRRTP
ncbi:MAG: ABC transporter permease [Burkholderiales bacterium]|nr:ABC transporter permease [Burkholderiales bacterium]